ncbi:CDP-glycerol glycerophosphotransferase family protein [Bacillus spongiae]|uniref:CDP-glycerol glycerophosphotransferase family protein n=1 Tax=Bacillus spongiae TaxID=2683610 RepID=A0ABU8HDY9_9BACI
MIYFILMIPRKLFSIFSNHEDIRELYLISNLLVTDYSSVLFDYVNLKRPMIFYAYDIDRYQNKLRGFYFDFENKAQGPLVKQTPDVIEAVRNYEQYSFIMPKSFEDFYRTFCYLESGHTTERVV